MTILTTTTPSKIAIIITAAGSSSRMGGSIKKEYLPYKNGTVLSACAEIFFSSCLDTYEITDFIITCPQGGIEECRKALEPLQEKLLNKITITEGGENRQKSVYKGLCSVKGEADIVLVHDGARPFVSKKIIIDGINAALKYGAAVPGISPTDTQKEVDEEGFIIKHLVRKQLSAVQTPQCFKFMQFLEAHKKALKDKHEYTDDTEIWGKYCGKVKTIEGDVKNIKITYASDIQKLGIVQGDKK